MKLTRGGFLGKVSYEVLADLTQSVFRTDRFAYPRQDITQGGGAPFVLPDKGET